MGEPRRNSQVSDNRFFSEPTSLASTAPAKLITHTVNDPDDPDTFKPTHPWRPVIDTALGKRIAFYQLSI